MKLSSATLTACIAQEFGGEEWKYWGAVCGRDNCIYGIPTNARRVVRLNPEDNTWVEIGPDLGPAPWKFRSGILASNGCIYCAPLNANKVLKIDTASGSVDFLDALLPETGDFMWSSGTLAADKNIYFMPAHAHYILKINPEDDSIESVGPDMGGGSFKYSGVVAMPDGTIFGIPHESPTVIRFDIVTQLVTTVGEEAEEELLCCTAVIGPDGFIYAASHENLGLIKIDASENTYSFVRNSYPPPVQQHPPEYAGWGSATMGDDGCIYWAPYCNNRTLKFDTMTQSFSLVGNDFGNNGDKWLAGAVTSDGTIYVMPSSANHILVIDPFKEFALHLKTALEQHPVDSMSQLFVKNDEGMTMFENIAIKYGGNRVLQLIEHHCPDQIPCEGIIMKPFMFAASFTNSDFSVIYCLLRRNPEALFTYIDV